jgi:hypothetical protein
MIQIVASHNDNLRGINYRNFFTILTTGPSTRNIFAFLVNKKVGKKYVTVIYALAYHDISSFMSLKSFTKHAHGILDFYVNANFN